MPRVLFVENQCSFTWNLVDALPVPRGQVRVCPAAEAGSLLAEHDVVVLGPGPKDPVRAGLVRIAQMALKRGMPLLGVCLGHQALGLALGATLVRRAPTHGKVHRVQFEAARWMPGVEGEHDVMRYHSLALDAVPPPLRVLARTREGVVMAVEHATLPALGLQFHPDSYGTVHGEEMLAAFFRAVGR